ncbi:MAG: glycosyltransferase [Lysobacterales bacterium]|nr:MAG: glycosyltransferase [Xanthomonadales bacterium]
MHALEHKISESPVRRFVTLLPFQQNPAAIWNASDIAVVPSEEPEPFGLVAVEAMSASKPVVAAAHGGLVEIVVPAVTGELFEPRNESQLAEVLTRLVLDPQRRAELGRAGRARYQAAFTEERFAAEVCDLIACIISPDSKCQNMGSPT